jgi:hypothetical protein
MSSAYSCFSHPDVCSGDHCSRSFLATSLRSRGFEASRQRFGRRALAQAASSAASARYASRPPCRAISRLTVEGARFSAAAIVRIDRPAAIPRETSSRSMRLSVRGARRRGVGAIPPRATTTLRMTALRRFSARPMARSGVPLFHMRQISSFSESNTQRLFRTIFVSLASVKRRYVALMH